MSAEKTQAQAPEETRAAPQPVPPYEYNPNYNPTAIEPDHAPVYPAPAAQQPVQPQPQFQSPQNQYPTAVPLHSLQRTPAVVDCPACHKRELTRVEFRSGGSTHGWAFLLCICVCLGCIPYMMSSLKDCWHHCGQCNKLLAKWHNSGHVEIIANHPTTANRTTAAKK